MVNVKVEKVTGSSETEVRQQERMQSGPSLFVFFFSFKTKQKRAEKAGRKDCLWTVEKLSLDLPGSPARKQAPRD